MPVSDPVSLFCVSVHVLKMTGSCRGTRNMFFNLAWLNVMITIIRFVMVIFSNTVNINNTS